MDVLKTLSTAQEFQVSLLSGRKKRGPADAPQQTIQEIIVIGFIKAEKKNPPHSPPLYFLVLSPVSPWLKESRGKVESGKMKSQSRKLGFSMALAR